MHLIRRFLKVITGVEHATVYLILAICCSVLAGACTATLIATIHQILKNGLPEEVGLTIIKFTLLWLVHGLFGVLSTWSITIVAQGLLHRMRLDFAKNILATSYAELERIGKSKVIATRSHTITIIADTTERLPGLVVRSVLLICLYFYLVLLSPFLFLTIIIFLIGGVFIYIWPTTWYRTLQKREIQAKSEVMQQIHTLLEGIKTLLQSSRKQQAFFNHYYVPISSQARQITIRSRLIESSINHWGELYLLLGLGIIMFVLPFWELATYAEMGDFLLIFLFTLSPMSTVIKYYYRLEQLVLALEEYNAIGQKLSTSSLSVACQTRVEFDAHSFESFTFENVSYHYDNSQIDAQDSLFDLGPLSFRIDHPQIVFITGGNGSGKSTLAKLLSGIYVPTSGSIYWNESRISEENRQAFKEQFAVVHFDFYLFDSLLGLEDENFDDVANQLLIKLGLDHKLSIMDGRFSTYKLSQGQRKRLMLLQAYLDDKPISIFDEFAADQDTDFKQYFYESWLPNLKAEGKTAIIISHDESYFYVADQIIKLVDGLQYPTTYEMKTIHQL